MAAFNNRILSAFNENEKEIGDDPKQLAVQYIQKYEETGDEIPEEIVDLIIKDRDLLFVYAISALKRKESPPDRILEYLVHIDLFETFLTAIKQFGMEKQVIEKLVKIAPKSSRASFLLMRFLYNNDVKIPDQLKVASAEYADKENVEIEFAHMLDWKNVPENILDAITLMPYEAYRYADEILKWKNLPEPILKAIAYDSTTAFRYAKNILKGKDVPDVVLDTIRDDEENTIEYAIFLHKNGIDIPEKVVESIIDGQTYIDNYISLVGWKNIPENILKNLLKNTNIALSYATVGLYGENVPDFVITQIAESHYAALRYAIYLDFKDVPPKILNSIFSSRSSTEYLDKLYHNYKEKIIHLMQDGDLTHDEAKILTMEYPSSLETDDPEQLKKEAIEKAKDILKQPRYAMPYAYNVLRGKNVPDFIIGVVSKVPYYAVRLFNTYNHFGFFSTPQETTLKLATLNVPHFAVQHIKEMFENNDIDEIPDKFVETISQIPKQVYYTLSLYDVMRKIKEIPPKFIESLKSAPYYAFKTIELYESAWGLERVSKELIEIVYNDIIENIEYSSMANEILYFIEKFLIPLYGNIPDKLIDEIVKSAEVFSYIGVKIAKLLLSNNIKIKDNLIDAIIKREVSFIDFIETTPEIPDYIIKEIPKNHWASYTYAKKLIWENVPDDILQSAFDYILTHTNKITNFNIVEKFPKLYDKLKDSKNFQRWYALPKKYAEKHNKEWGGLLFHAMDTLSQAEFTLEVKEDKELCISTFDSNHPFRGGVILVGKGPIRLLYDFDCYSFHDDDGLRYATSQGEELAKQDIDDIEDLSRGERIKRAGFKEIGDNYYDEGFILPSKVEWLCVTGQDEYTVKSTSDKYNLPMFNIDQFNKIIKRGDVKILYDIIRGTEELPPGPDEYDQYTIDKPKSDRHKKIDRGKGKKPKSKKIKRQDKRELVQVEEEHKFSLKEALRRLWTK